MRIRSARDGEESNSRANARNPHRKAMQANQLAALFGLLAGLSRVFQAVADPSQAANLTWHGTLGQVFSHES
jgi:hypothetical protein